MNQTSQAITIYCTTPDTETASRIGTVLVSEHLVACVNILGPMRSLYHWNGVLHDETEVVFIAKTNALRQSEGIARIKELHPYECPCIVVLPIIGGYADFLEWIYANSLDPLKK